MSSHSGVDLTVDLCGVHLPNPVILASGILGTEAALMERVGRGGAGAVTSKSCSSQPRAGHPNPTVIKWGPGFLNAVGLANPGVEAQVEILRETRRRLADTDVAIIGSIFAETVDGFARVAETLSSAEPDLLEVNISCPNVAHEFGAPFASAPETAAAVTRAVKAATDIPVIVKLSPNVTDIAIIARAVEDAGADAIAAINTVSGMVIDIEAARPVLSNREGGISGPAIKPIAVRSVYRCYEAVSIPIIGIGGVSSGADAIEMIMAGASAVGVGSAVFWGGVGTLGQIAREMAEFMADHGYERVSDMVGLAHRPPALFSDPE
ncbi:MAG: dihydroorotate dehydrogenase [Anaerolineae bacterium]|nr:dihydroorotate dehydrogenase [Anaerolineae bacterium]